MAELGFKSRPSAPNPAPSHGPVRPLGARGLRPQRQPFLLLIKASVRPQKAGGQPCRQIPGLMGILGVPWHLSPGELEAPWGKVETWMGGCRASIQPPVHVWEGKGLFHAGAPRDFFWRLPESRVVPAGVGRMVWAFTP